MSEYFEQVERELRGAIRRRAHVPERRGVVVERASGLRDGVFAVAAWLGSPRHRWSKAALGLAGAGAAAAVVISIVSLGSNPERAFAGWTAAPTKPTAAQLKAVESACVEQTRSGVGAALFAPHGASESPAPQWHATIVDPRGPYLMMDLETADGNARARCLYGPSGAHIVGGGQGSDTVVEPPASAPDEVAIPSVERFGESSPTRGDNRWSEARGRTGSEVTGVTFVMSDGSEVVASTEDERFLAWWPSWERPVSVEVTTASGTHTEAFHER